MDAPAQVIRLEHIGIAVRSIESARVLYEQFLGLKAEPIEELDHLKLRVLRLNAPNDLAVELIEGQEGEETITRFIERNGEGIHHICFDVADVEAATAAFMEEGYSPVWETPKSGSHGKKVNFLRPKDTNGVLIEISQERA